MITDGATLITGAMNSYAAASDWGVTIVKSPDDSRITIQLSDPHGAPRATGLRTSS
ncbi:hypothetical protein [Rhizobium leguminosarum]|uniref:hypothetical protein n=1 Tax=Rhizobium leguminosarum TaxID=384 RepID=UPI002E1596ED|nr:hypothetical protein U8Q02_36920 [Rhizobium leguminosarum]